MIALPELIDHAMPFAGPCGFCGDDDRRHRILDAIAERLRAEDGDSAEETAADFGLSVEVVEAIGEHWNESRQAWLEERHEPTINTHIGQNSGKPISIAECSCGWLYGRRITHQSARRAWRRHLERAT